MLSSCFPFFFLAFENFSFLVMEFRRMLLYIWDISARAVIGTEFEHNLYQGMVSLVLSRETARDRDRTGAWVANLDR